MERVGKYQLIRKLATGGMAEVFLARAEGPGGFSKKLVLKRILPHFLSDSSFASMFLSEARVAAELNHPNVVQIFDFGEVDGQYYLAMEYIDGANLRILNTASIDQHHRIPFTHAARMVSQAAEGLHFVHELRGDNGEHLGLIHRDISPDNILVSRSGAVKVLDFGIAKANAQPSLTHSGVIKGKMAYMSPEQMGRKPLDKRIDIFGLGVVLHELTTGTWPFDTSSEVNIIQAIMNENPLPRAREVRPEIPEALDAIIAKCLEKSRELRYATCKELQADLEQFIASTREPVYPAHLSELVNLLVPPTSNPDISEPMARAPSSLSTPAPLPKSNRTQESRWLPMVAVGIATLAALLAGGMWATRERARSLRIPVEPRPSPGIAVSKIVDAGMPLRGPVSTPVSNEPGAPEKDLPTVPRTVRIEFRIRPFAQVFLDGKNLGQTPFPPVPVTVGRHTLRLVNEPLKKDIELEQQFHPGDSLFKYNLKE